MPRKNGAYWVIPPQAILIPGVNKYLDRVRASIIAVLEYVGLEMQDAGRRNAGWKNITGNARSGLFYAVEGFGHGPHLGQITIPDAGYWAEHYKDLVQVTPKGKNWAILTYSHSMSYGKFLEIRGGKYAIIITEFARGMPLLERMLKDTFR